MDEAAWLYQYGGTDGIEGGFFSGAGYNVPWTTGLLPYYTFNSITSEVDGRGHYLQPNTTIPIRVINGGKVQVNDWTATFSHWVNGSQLNFAQGEVDTHNGKTNTWLGNGGGEHFQALWTPDGSHWYTWGFHNDCANRPYWIVSKGKDQFVNGGPWGG